MSDDYTEQDIERELDRKPLVDHRLTVEDLQPNTTYGRHFFLKLELGVSLPVAAAALRITPDEVSTWYSRGQEDYASSDPEAEQSPYATFYASCLQSVGIITAKAESSVTHRNPEKFLQRGSAQKLIGPQWEEPRNLPHVQNNQMVVNVQDNSQANVITLSNIAELVEIAKEVGLTGRVLEGQATKVVEHSSKDELIQRRDDIANPDASPTSSDMMNIDKLKGRK